MLKFSNYAKGCQNIPKKNPEGVSNQAKIQKGPQTTNNAKILSKSPPKGSTNNKLLRIKYSDYYHEPNRKEEKKKSHQKK